MDFLSTGQAANALGVTMRRLDYAIKAGHAGRVTYGAGRRLLSAANIRTLARHFNVPVPGEGLTDLDPADLEQVRERSAVDES